MPTRNLDGPTSDDWLRPANPLPVDWEDDAYDPGDPKRSDYAGGL